MKNYPILKHLINKSNKIYKILTVVFLVVSILSVAIAAFIDSKSMPEPQPFNNAIYEEKSAVWSYIDVELMSDYYAYLEDDDGDELHRYYVVWDNEYLYIALLDNETFNRLSEVFEYSFSEDENAIPPAPVRITGMSEAISDDLKQLTIETLNEWYGDNYVTEEDFQYVVGNVLINVKEDPISNASEIPFIIGFVSFILFITFGIVWLIFSIQNKNAFKKIPTEDLQHIENQIENGTTYNIPGLNIHLTKSYLVDLTNRLQAYPYEHICWMYIFRVKQYGITTSVALKIGLRNGKVKTLGTVPRKNENDLMNIMLECSNYCNDLMLGYTKENIRAFKEIKKNK